MNLPDPIQIYFNADGSVDAPAPLAAFAPDASVKDEGKTHVGHAAIQTWWTAAKTQNRHRTTPRERSQDRDVTTVRAEVAGEFPGSPALLTFKFHIASDRIMALEIDA